MKEDYSNDLSKHPGYLPGTVPETFVFILNCARCLGVFLKERITEILNMRTGNETGCLTRLLPGSLPYLWPPKHFLEDLFSFPAVE
jgi:hypothetical protein